MQLRKTVNNIAPVSGPTFDSSDRHILDQVWNHLQSRDASKGEGSGSGTEKVVDLKKKIEVWKKVIREDVTSTEASRQVDEEAAGTDASEPVF